MRTLTAFFLLTVSAFGQNSQPPAGAFTKVAPNAGYFDHVIGQFDKAVWIPSRGCYSLWGQYKSATFSEANDMMGCYSYADNQWKMLMQSTAQHSIHRPETGHQWGDSTYVPGTDTLYWVSNSGAQNMEANYILHSLDMAGLTGTAIPLQTLSGALSRPWQGGGVSISGYMEYDSTHSRVVFFPDTSLSTGHATICTIGVGSTMACQISAITNGPPATQQISALRFDPDDGFTYFLPGSQSSMTVYRIDASTPASGWQNFASPACTGADCVSGHPPVRGSFGWAYSTHDHIWVLLGGMNGGTPVTDAWTFDPAAGSGAGAWNELCGPGVTSCGSPGSTYPVFTVAREGDRLVYDPADNVFITTDDGGSLYLYVLPGSTALNYGRTALNAFPAVGVSPITGPLNRTLPPTTGSPYSNAQTGAFDLSMSTSGGTVYLSHVEPAVPADATSCQFPVPYIWSSTAVGNWLPGGTQNSACAAIGNNSNNQPAGHVFAANIGGTIWEVHNKRNFLGFSTNSKSIAQSYNSGAGTWSGGDLPCYSNACFSPPQNTYPQNYPQGLVSASGVPTALTIEPLGSFTAVSNVYVSQWNGTAWTSLSGSTGLNILGSAFVSYAGFNSDPSGNIMVCWTEEVDSGRQTMATTPQLRCKYWNGSSFITVHGGSLNQTSTDWTYSPSVVYASGTWYVAFVEQSQTGRQQLYVKSCPITGSPCTLVGSGALNHTPSTGMVYHPSLAADGANVMLGWEEQSDVGQHAQGYISKWNGTSWTAVVSGIATDTANGSVSDLSVVVPTSGTVTAAWTEMSWGNMPQIYMASYSVTPPCTITTTTLPSGSTGLAYSQQVNTSSCSSPAFSVSAGSLPTGLSISAGGLISGTPTGSGTSSFTVAVSDSQGNPTQPLSITINTPSLSVPLTVQELLCSGCSTGIARVNEPLTVGIPIPDSQNITGVSGLNLIGATAAQFSSSGVWPSGNIKWLKIRAIVPSVSAGGTATLTLTNAGTGNFGGPNLGTDNGSTITVSTNGGTCGAGSAICFTIKKANYNVVDQMQIGATTMVSTGTSDGLVVMGPNPTATYPGNVTCSPTSGGTACTVAYKTSNDAGSNCTLEENGPAVAVALCTADLNDGSAHVYMHTTTRMYFYYGSSAVKATVSLRNADLGVSSTFASATKGHQGFELRIKANFSGTLSYTIANHTGTPTTGTLASGGGTDYAYIYQANSNILKQAGQCTSPCVNPASISGYAIVNNGTASQTGTVSQYPVGWAEISDSGNKNIVIGYEQLAGYQNKSLEFRGGGTDVRVGMWAAENNTTSPSTTTANAPYYQAWPQHSIHNVFLEFNTAQPTSAQNDFLRFQYSLAARADYSWYNTSAVFPYPMLSAAEEDTFYSATFAASSPPVTARTPSDLPIGNTSNSDILCGNFVCIFSYYNWSQVGGGNQMEFRLTRLFDFIRRGYTGGYLQSSYFYKYMSEWAFPRSDGFSWATQSATQYYDYETATSNNSSLASGLWNVSHGTYLENDGEHANGQGLPYFYWVSGDETFRDAAKDFGDMYLNTVAASSYQSLTPFPSLWNDRSAGNAFFAGYVFYDFYRATGDSTNAATIKANMERVYASRLHPALCSYPGYPTGCTPDVNNNIPQVGVSLERGLSNVFRDTSFQVPGACGSSIQNGPRTAASFMNSRKLEGMYLLHQMEDPSWVNYYEEWDRAYGGALWALNEMYHDNGTSSYTGNGFRYKQAFDFANACADSGNVMTGNFSVGNDQTIWFNWFVKAAYEGNMSATDQRQLKQVIQFDSSIGAFDEFFHFTVGAPIYSILHPTPISLSTQPITVVDQGGGSYTVSWSVPAGAQSYRIKWGAKRIVDWIGFDAGTYSFIGDPSTTQNWFASTDAGTPPLCVFGNCGINISTGVTGLTSANFMVKAYVSGCSIAPTTLGPYTNGQVISQTMTAVNCGGGTLTWTSTGLPIGLTGCNSVTGTTCLLSGTLTTSTTYTPSISVTDGASNSASITPTVVVNQSSPAVTGLSSGNMTFSGATKH